MRSQYTHVNVSTHRRQLLWVAVVLKRRADVHRWRDGAMGRDVIVGMNEAGREPELLVCTHCERVGDVK